MKQPQVVNLLDDTVIAISGDSVIDDSDQLPLGSDHSVTNITVKVALLSLKSGGSMSTLTNVAMTYDGLTDFWVIQIADLVSTLPGFSTDRIKYTGKISEPSGTNDMRDFKLEEFSVDNDSFEASWMRLPYEVVVSGGQAWMIWYEDGYIGVAGREKYKAPAYEGGTGTTYATDPARITHRGAIVDY